jgi:steroid 5-alpha reductase family enzyme
MQIMHWAKILLIIAFVISILAFYLAKPITRENERALYIVKIVGMALAVICLVIAIFIDSWI